MEASVSHGVGRAGAIGVAMLVATAAIVLLRPPPPIPYAMVDQLESGHVGREVRVHGYVAAGTIARFGPVGYRFVLVWHGHRLAVVGRGALPDAVRDTSELVVRGELEGDHLDARELSGCCPSKYEGTAACSRFH